MTDRPAPAAAPAAETGRDRVRRLFIEPLNAAGFKPNLALTDKRGDDGKIVQTAAQRHAAFLTRLTGYLGYMTDDGLRTLQEVILFNGDQGEAPDRRRRAPRDRWPRTALIVEFANAIEPCPIERWPGMASWFGSVAGPAALADDTAVETHDFILERKHPPFHRTHKDAIRAAAADRRHRIRAVERAEAQGAIVTPGEKNELARYRARLARVTALIERFQAAPAAPVFRHKQEPAA